MVILNLLTLGRTGRRGGTLSSLTFPQDNTTENSRRLFISHPSGSGAARRYVTHSADSLGPFFIGHVFCALQASTTHTSPLPGPGRHNYKYWYQ